LSVSENIFKSEIYLSEHKFIKLKEKVHNFIIFLMKDSLRIIDFMDWRISGRGSPSLANWSFNCGVFVSRRGGYRIQLNGSRYLNAQNWLQFKSYFEFG